MVIDKRHQVFFIFYHFIGALHFSFQLLTRERKIENYKKKKNKEGVGQLF